MNTVIRRHHHVYRCMVSRAICVGLEVSLDKLLQIIRSMQKFKESINKIGSRALDVRIVDVNTVDRKAATM